MKYKKLDTRLEIGLPSLFTRMITVMSQVPSRFDYNDNKTISYTDGSWFDISIRARL